MDTWLILMVAGAAIGGTIIGLLGWAKQRPPQPLELRTFVITLGDSILAGTIYAITLATKTDNMTKDILTAAVFGAGGDMLIRGVAGTIQAKAKGQTPNVLGTPPASPPNP